MGNKREERVYLSLADEWFNVLIESLLQVQRVLKAGAETNPDAKWWEAYLEKNEKLISKFERYGQYFDAEDGQARMQAGLFRSEAEDLIWQLLLAADVHNRERPQHYEKFKQAHEDFQNRPPEKIVVSSDKEPFEINGQT